MKHRNAPPKSHRFPLSVICMRGRGSAQTCGAEDREGPGVLVPLEEGDGEGGGADLSGSVAIESTGAHAAVTPVFLSQA